MRAETADEQSTPDQQRGRGPPPVLTTSTLRSALPASGCAQRSPSATRRRRTVRLPVPAPRPNTTVVDKRHSAAEYISTRPIGLERSSSQPRSAAVRRSDVDRPPSQPARENNAGTPPAIASTRLSVRSLPHQTAAAGPERQPQRDLVPARYAARPISNPAMFAQPMRRTRPDRIVSTPRNAKTGSSVLVMPSKARMPYAGIRGYARERFVDLRMGRAQLLREHGQLRRRLRMCDARSQTSHDLELRLGAIAQNGIGSGRVDRKPQLC